MVKWYILLIKRVERTLMMPNPYVLISIWFWDLSHSSKEGLKTGEWCPRVGWGWLWRTEFTQQKCWMVQLDRLLALDQRVLVPEPWLGDTSRYLLILWLPLLLQRQPNCEFQWSSLKWKNVLFTVLDIVRYCDRDNRLMTVQQHGGFSAMRSLSSLFKRSIDHWDLYSKSRMWPLAE